MEKSLERLIEVENKIEEKLEQIIEQESSTLDSLSAMSKFYGVIYRLYMLVQNGRNQGPIEPVEKEDEEM